MAKYRTARQWASLIARYETGAMTQAAFCHRHQLAPSTFGYQLRRHPAGAARKTLLEKSSQPQLLELAPCSGPQPLFPAIDSPGVRIEWTAARGGSVWIHCQSHQVGEILAQIPALPPSDS